MEEGELVPPPFGIEGSRCGRIGDGARGGRLARDAQGLVGHAELLPDDSEIPADPIVAAFHDEGLLTTTPGRRRCSGSISASRTLEPGPASEPFASKNAP